MQMHTIRACFLKENEDYHVFKDTITINLTSALNAKVLLKTALDALLRGFEP